MAEVFAARVRGEGGFEKLVAVKRMLPHLAEDPQFVRMFLDEARVAANLASANVVQTLDIGRTEDGALYIVMELVLGLSLAELLPLGLERGPIPIDVCVEVLAQAATGLHDAHEARAPAGDPLGLVHRDVSPQNLLVGIDGRVRITDFGIARVTESRLVHTQHGTIKGKFAYFSPEQSRGAELDRRSDVFALGVVAWEMLAGRRLFARRSPIEMTEAVRNGEIPRIDAARRGVPPGLAEAVHRALERSIDRRWQSAREMADALRESLGSVGSTPAVVAAFVGELRADRIVQLEARVREAVASPEIRTLPDIEIELPDADATVLDPPALEGTVFESQTVPLAGTGSRARGRASRRALVAAGVLVAIAAGVAAVLSSTEPPVAQTQTGETVVPDGDARRERVTASPPAAAPEEGEAAEPTDVAPSDEQADHAQPEPDEAQPAVAETEPRTRPSQSRWRSRRGRTQAQPVEDPAEPARPTQPSTMGLRPGQVIGVPEGL
jgi:serine/threonine-protein kinase